MFQSLSLVFLSAPTVGVLLLLIIGGVCLQMFRNKMEPTVRTMILALLIIVFILWVFALIFGWGDVTTPVPVVR
jgi:hypothetical protein